MSTREISECIEDIYGTEVNKDLVTKITDKILLEILNWKSRILESTYSIVFVNGIRFKVKEDNEFKEKSVYIALGVDLEGKKTF